MRADREQILETTLGLAQKIGWEKTSVREIARRVGYSTIKIYSEFGSKDQLLEELQKKGFAQLKKEYLSAIEGAASAEEALICLSLAHLCFAQAHKRLYELMFSLNGAGCKSDVGVHKRSTGEPVQLILKKLAGRLDRTVFFNWWALLHGFVIVTGEDAYLTEEEKAKLLKELIRNLIKGLGSYSKGVDGT